ncbi:hypothetical protein VTJ04DRAFT_8483 [Mycothermus thermophilus]|uniref:uncharacterized protein n=1 Tax=Humicola insolens TaxID=85995 RepID=UPI003741FB17
MAPRSPYHATLPSQMPPIKGTLQKSSQSKCYAVLPEREKTRCKKRTNEKKSVIPWPVCFPHSRLSYALTSTHSPLPCMRHIAGCLSHRLTFPSMIGGPILHPRSRLSPP